MSTLLLGDATEDYTASNNIFDGLPTAFKFTAVATDTLDTLAIRAAEVSSSPDTLELGIYADAGGVPGALLDSGVIAGPFSAAQWVQVTGLSAAITTGTEYHLAALAVGGNFYLRGGASGIAEIRDNTTRASLQSTWDNASSVDYGEDGHPVGFQGLHGPLPDETPADETPRSSDLVWHLTGLWYPGETSVAYYGQIVDPTGDSYIDTLDDQSTGEVTFSAHAQDPYLLANLIGKAYARFLKIYDCGRLAFWGPYKLGKVDFSTGICTLNCVDPSLRLSRHVLRRGDLLGTLNEANHDRGSVSVDHIGLRQLRDAGKNSAEQTAEGYPDLGIGDGDNDYDEFPFNRMGVKRLDQVYNSMQQLSQSLGPDFSLRPVEDVVGTYALLDTFQHQGDDLSATLQLHFGTGLQNLENLQLDEGAKYTTHIHVLPRDHPETYRFTQANPAAAILTGPYVDADTTDFDSEGIDPSKVEDVLRAYGDDYLKAYGRPLMQVTLTLPVDGPGVPRYGIDFKNGDTIGVAGRLKGPGGITLCDLPPAPYRITSVQRVRDGEGVRSVITVVGDMVAAADDAVAGAGSGDET